jgi:hypothetical protein
MPLTSVTVRPGVNTMMTLSQNEAGISRSNLVRYQQSMIQKYGGWQQYYPVAIGSTIKELWGWEGLTGNKYLGIGATQSLSVIFSGANTVITPQTATTNPPPNFTVSTAAGQQYTVTVIDNGSSANLLTTVFFNTPVSVGNLLLSGAYPVTAALGANSYQITSSVACTVSAASTGLIPFFTLSAGSPAIQVDLPNNNYPAAATGLYEQFIAPTNLGGITIQGPYSVTSVINSASFIINSPIAASSAATGYMNGGFAQLKYYYTVGSPSALGYGLGYWGGSSAIPPATSPSSLWSGYGTGGLSPAGGGTPITATDWSLVNWGEALLACASNGPIYVWSSNIGYSTASVIPTAPFFNGGIFVSQPQQILVAWGSVQSTGTQDPLIVRWSDALDYTSWTPTSQNWAGSFHIPTGSLIRGGIQSAQLGIIWTDIDVYVMQNVGQPIVFGFQKVGAGCGLIGMHAMGILNGQVYWMGTNNFFVLGPNGVVPITCPVWNFIFQNIDVNNIAKVRCAVNNTFNEISWFFPAINGTGENTLYVKHNVVENEWDYGTLGRSAWIDVTVLGNPIGADLSGIIWQHEQGYNAGTVAMDSTFQTGYWNIADGNEMVFVDWIVPDMTFAPYAGSATSASLNLTFYATDYPSGPVRTYGPYVYNNTTQYINTRIRGRLMSMKVEGMDLNTFWRIGRIRYRYAPDGRY